MEGNYSTWKDAAEYCIGYQSDEILAKALDATLKVYNGQAAFERDSVVFDEIEYSWPLLAGLMLAAARNGGKLHVLDFGGALGSSYFQNRRFLASLSDVRWNIIEQPHFVAAGRTYIEHGNLRFYGDVDECLAEHEPNVALFSGVLQCLSEPWGILGRVLRIGCDTVILDRTCYVNHGNRERIRIQQVPESIYRASYPCRFFVEREMVSFIEKAGYRLVEQFDALDKLDPDASWKGHIFVRQDGE